MLVHGRDDLYYVILLSQSAHDRKDLTGQCHAGHAADLPFHPLSLIIIIAVKPGMAVNGDFFLLADVIESTSRALQPNSEKAIEKLVNSLIDEDLTEGQLDESGLTLGDIRKIRESFIKTLKGRFHVRVKYPGNDELLSPAEQAATQTAVAQPNLPADVAPVPLKEEMS